MINAEALPGKTRVCMLVFSNYPNDPRVRREAAALVRKGLDVDVYCLRQPHELSEEVCDGVTVYRIMDTPRSKEALTRYLWHTLRFTWRALVRVGNQAGARSYALYQVHTMPDFLIFACLAAKWQGKPIILDLHDLSVELFAAKLQGARRHLLALVALQERLACRFADHLITTSWGFKARLLQRGNPEAKITLVFNSADPSLFWLDDSRQFRPIGHRLRLLYHGTIAERFGLHLLLEALPLIRSRHRDVSLRLYGKIDPSYQRRLTQIVREFGLSQHVEFAGWRPAAALMDCFREADLAVVPYLHDAFMDLAVSTKTFEYAAAGLPVVATRLQAMTSIFPEDSITYVAPNDSEALARGVLQLAADPARQAHQSRAAYAAQQQLSGEVMAERYTTLVERMLGAQHDAATSVSAPSRPG
ncbi:glycosyltransferase family 4 protein [uncultured Thiohalocapsa sp.]|uniref:glycosyltransferase family 4 protein n=1 Tax=uncultured Thiohalocapsa sp. TaxID=768990 RepID=UPI0025ED3D9D|nr:glycosyltransferase family 4 protein [uncultured Thiohalocapsa sp.]